jgi:hypothetical protein
MTEPEKTGFDVSRISSLLVALAAVTTAIIGVLAYLDNSGRLENPIGGVVTEVIDRDGGTTTTDGTSATRIDALTVDANGCPIVVEWAASGDSDGHLELFRDGETVDDSLPVGSGSHDDSAYDLYGEGSYQVTYELVGYDAAGNELDRESASGESTCIG